MASAATSSLPGTDEASAASSSLPGTDEASAASSSLLGTDSPWVGRPPPVAVLPRPAVAVRPREKSCYRKPRPVVPVPPETITVLPCTACRKVGSTSQPECRECARALRKAKAEATEKQARAAVRPVRLATRRAADSADDTAAEQRLTREESCRNRVLTSRLAAAERNVHLAEALVAGRPQHWVRHRPQHDRLVPLRIGDVLLPDDSRQWGREEAATVTAVTDLEVHVQWSSDGSVGTILQECIGLPVVRAPNASQAPTTASAGKYRAPDELRKMEQHLATPHVGFLTTCDALAPTHPRAPSHPVQQPLICHLRTPPEKPHSARVPASIVGSKPAVIHSHNRSDPQDAASTARDAAIDFSASFSQHMIATPNDVGRWTATVEGALERFQQSAMQPPQVCASFRHVRPLKPARERTSPSMPHPESLSARNAAGGTTARLPPGTTQQLGPLRWGEAGGTPTWAPHSPRHQFPKAARPVGMAAEDASVLSVGPQSPTQTFRNGVSNPFYIAANASQSSLNSLGSWDSAYGYREASPRNYMSNEDLQASWRAESISSAGKGFDSSQDLALYKTDPAFPPTEAVPGSALELSRSVEWADEPLGSTGCGVPRGSSALLMSRAGASPIRLSSDAKLQVTLTL